MDKRRGTSARVGLLIFAMTLVVAFLSGIPAASAAGYTGPLTPTIYGGLADMNGSGTATSADDWTAFYGDTSIIDGGLDCDNWGATENQGDAGDGTIDAGDDCFLRGYDGTLSGVVVEVVDGSFDNFDGIPIPSGTPLPEVFNAGDPDNPSVFDSDFAWQVIDGRVDANGNDGIDGDDCSIGIVGGGNILSEGAGTSCGMAGGPYTAALNGLVDVNNSLTITSTDDCTNCILGQDVVDGFVGGIPVPVPNATAINPTSGNVGITVTITGSDLSGVTSITFDGTPGTNISNNTSTSVQVTVPNIALGPASVVVTTAGGPDPSPLNFTVTSIPAPNATSMSPTSGGVGTQVTITGTNLSNATVTFNGVAAVCSSNTATQIVCTVPNTTTGPVVVTTGGGSDPVGTFTVIPTPNATSMSPTSGPVGTQVTIVGTNLSNATVRFNGVQASCSSNTATQIVCTVPNTATTGPVTVQTSGGTDPVGTFTVTVSPPTITSFSPGSGKVGTQVIINGTNFTGTTVRFGTVTAAFTVNSLSQITTAVPAGAGTSRISVTTAAGTATSGLDFVVKHSRSVSLHFSKASGSVSVLDGWSQCGSIVPVRIQTKVNGKWRNVFQGFTNSNGSYSFAGINDPGKYRVVVKKFTTAAGDVCLKDKSPVASL